MPLSLFLIVNGACPGTAVPVVPQSLLCAVVAPDIGPVAPSYDVDAAFMLQELHERGNHAVRARCQGGGRDGGPLAVHP